MEIMNDELNSDELKKELVSVIQKRINYVITRIESSHKDLNSINTSPIEIQEKPWVKSKKFERERTIDQLTQELKSLDYLFTWAMKL